MSFFNIIKICFGKLNFNEDDNICAEMKPTDLKSPLLNDEKMNK